MRNRLLKKHGWLFIITAVFLLVPSVSVFVPKASALTIGGCSGPPYTQIWYGRDYGCGFFYNQYVHQAGGMGSLVPGGVGYMHFLSQFINLTVCGIFRGGVPGWAIAGVPQDGGSPPNCGAIGAPTDNRAYTTSVFYVVTMLGEGAGVPKSVSQGQLTQWEEDLEGGYASYYENGSTSAGPDGSISWQANHAASNCWVGTTYYQVATDDIGIYANGVAGPPPSGCGPNWQMIDFHNNNGSDYILESACGNTTYAASGLANYTPDFTLSPNVTASVNGGPAQSGLTTVAEVGDTVTFNYSVNNSGTTSTSPYPISCNFYTNETAYNPSPGVGNPDGSPPGCPSAYGTGQANLGSETVTLTAADQGNSVCRALSVNPYSYGAGPSSPSEACVVVAYEPYLKVFGGDVSAGAGVSTAPSVCTPNNDGSIDTWNKEALNGYSGAGAEYAASALSAITDFATAQNNATTPTPSGLAFANTNIASGSFGGNFGALNCIPDYYSTKPASAQPLVASPDVSTMTTGAYAGSGSFNLTSSGAGVKPSQRISIYVDGNVYINSNIEYDDSGWNLNSIPLLQLIVKGNIYIGSNVSRLDGVYIAQQSNPGVSSDGVIYTCATGSAASPSVPSTTNGAFYNTCNNKLTVNGTFTANSIEFLRTAGSLSGSSPGETSDVNGNGTNAAEVFNFNPAVWLAQPITNGLTNGYNAVTSLPPVL